MVTILLICFVTGSDWRPPDGWSVVSVSNRSQSAAVTLSRKAKSGETVAVPSGCATEEASTRTLVLPYGGWGTLNDAVP